MARQWERARPYAKCGRCGEAIPELDPILTIVLAGAVVDAVHRRGAELYRCVTCADDPVDEAQLAAFDAREARARAALATSTLPIALVTQSSPTESRAAIAQRIRSRLEAPACPAPIDGRLAAAGRDD